MSAKTCEHFARYHVPRSFLRDDMNTLVLFEEFGGNPSLVNFRTTVVDEVCANAYEGHKLELSCHGNGRTISAVEFASFGDPQGTCETLAKGSCESYTALSVLKQQCVGQENCSVDVSEASLGSTNCGNITKKFAVQVKCQ